MISLASGIYLKIASDNLFSTRYGFMEFKVDSGEWPFDYIPISSDKGLQALTAFDSALRAFSILLLTFGSFGLVNLYCFLIFLLRDEMFLPYHECIREKFRYDVFADSLASMSDRNAMLTEMFPAESRYIAMSDLSDFDPAYPDYYSDYDLGRDSNLNYTAVRNSEFAMRMENDIDRPSIESNIDRPSVDDLSEEDVSSE